MPRFFMEFSGGDTARITGADAVHIRRSLRMKPGEELVVCNGRGTDYTCRIAGFEGEDVLLAVLFEAPTCSEPSVAVTLYQGLPKGDKMEWIIQKAVELGVAAIVPVATARSIVRLDGKEEKKRERWQRIAAEAAGQCGRGLIPPVSVPLTWKEALAAMAQENAVVFYEGGGAPLRQLAGPETTALSIVVGPEGGFAPEEIAALEDAGVRTATLGPRILRCETAPLAALSAIMLLTGNMD